MAVERDLSTPISDRDNKKIDTVKDIVSSVFMKCNIPKAEGLLILAELIGGALANGVDTVEQLKQDMTDFHNNVMLAYAEDCGQIIIDAKKKFAAFSIEEKTAMMQRYEANSSVAVRVIPVHSREEMDAAKARGLEKPNSTKH